MKRLLYFLSFTFLVNNLPNKIIAQKSIKKINLSSIIRNSEVSSIDKYVNEINNYMKLINEATKDNDTLIALNQLELLKSTHRFTKNTSEKKVSYSNSKIVKEKYTDFLENNFIKIRSFYYQNNLLVCVSFFEIRPIKDRPLLISKRTIYYNKGEIVFDTKQQTASKQISTI